MKRALPIVALFLGIATSAPAQNEDVFGMQAGSLTAYIFSVVDDRDKPAELKSGMIHEGEEVYDRPLWISAVDVSRTKVGNGHLILYLFDPSGVPFYVPVTPGRENRALREIQDSIGEVLRLEYYPAESTFSPDLIAASWLITPRNTRFPRAPVPISRALRGEMQRRFGANAPIRGIFAPIGEVYRATKALNQHVNRGDGLSTDIHLAELRRTMKDVEDNPRLDVDFSTLTTRDGITLSEEGVRALVLKGRCRAAQTVIEQASQEFIARSTVRDEVARFRKLWAECPPAHRAEIRFGLYPAELKEKEVTEERLDRLLILSAQSWLIDAKLRADAGYPDAVLGALRNFDEERGAIRNQQLLASHVFTDNGRPPRNGGTPFDAALRNRWLTKAGEKNAPPFWLGVWETVNFTPWFKTEPAIRGLAMEDNQKATRKLLAEAGLQVEEWVRARAQGADRYTFRAWADERSGATGFEQWLARHLERRRTETERVGLAWDDYLRAREETRIAWRDWKEQRLLERGEDVTGLGSETSPNS